MEFRHWSSRWSRFPEVRLPRPAQLLHRLGRRSRSESSFHSAPGAGPTSSRARSPSSSRPNSASTNHRREPASAAAARSASGSVSQGRPRRLTRCSVQSTIVRGGGRTDLRRIPGYRHRAADFAGITALVSLPNVLVVEAQRSTRRSKDLVAARQGETRRLDELRLGGRGQRARTSTASGSGWRPARTMQHIPYKGGPEEA